jgi:hypothetical protein
VNTEINGGVRLQVLLRVTNDRPVSVLNLWNESSRLKSILFSVLLSMSERDAGDVVEHDSAQGHYCSSLHNTSDLSSIMPHISFDIFWPSKKFARLHNQRY